MSSSTTTRWSNWAGNQTADGVAVIRPRGTEELVAAVAGAARAGERLRPIGSGHSFTGIGVPMDRQLVLDRHADLVAFDAATGRVTVQAGMPLHRLNLLLEQAGFALTNLGDIDVQTVAGALSTGTHGTGASYGGLATQLVGFDLVTPDGGVLTCSATENADVFAGGRVSLGALGVLDTLTLQAVPAFAIRAQETSADLGEVLDGFAELIEGPDHAEFYWFPHTTRTLLKRNTRLPREDGLAPVSRLRHWWDDEFLSNSLFGATVDLGRRWPGAVRPLARVAARALGDRTYTDLSHHVFVSPRRVRFVEMEYAVPRAAAVDVLRELVATVERSDWRIPVPVEVRVAAADDLWLSTAYDRDSAYVAVHVPPGSPDQAAYFDAVERIAGAVGGRPHWGKLHGLDAATLAGCYPRFGDFVALRDRLDPGGLLSNEYLDRVLGVPPGRRR